MLLLIDDDPKFRGEAQEMPALQPMVAASDLQHAIGLISTLSDQLSLALVDLDLPGEDGFQVIRVLKSRHPELPVIAISGVVQGDVLESAKCVGADEVLSKPISPEWLPVLDRCRRVSR